MRETPSQELTNLISHGREERNLEYKGPMSWKQRDVKVEITRSILGMANLRDGGFIVLGVKQQGNNFEPVGMQTDQIRSFTQDHVDDYVRNYADPFVETKVTQVPHDGMEFVVIQVREFEELPVICKKYAKQKYGKQQLRKGAIYIRSRGKAETAEVPSQTEMREIMNLAVGKGISRFHELSRLNLLGILDFLTKAVASEAADVEKFDQQLEEME